MTARAFAMIAVAVAVALGVSDVAHADKIEVKVTEIAGGLAYVTPGADAGLRPGQTVAFAAGELAIVEVTATTAVVRIGTTAIGVGDRGSVTGVAQAGAQVSRMPPPRPPSTWTAQWPAPVLPSTQQSPVAVPLGQGRPPGRLHARVLATGMFTPRSSSSGERRSIGGDGDARARLIVSYDLWQGRPLAADLDVTGRLYSRGFDTAAGRTPIAVRTAQLRYGPAPDPTVALGRLPWAATGVGMLDGVRAAAHLGAFELAGFGGMIPDALDGKPSTDAARFGAEAIYDDPRGAWQPRVALTAYGSTWNGTLDERRLAAEAEVSHGGVDLDGWVEAQQFPGDNPWGAHSVELTGAGLGGEYRRRGIHAGADVAMLRPERSLRLAAQLPASWLCTRPLGTSDPGACVGDELWAWATASAGFSTRRFAIDAGGSVGTTHGTERFVDASAFGRLELRGLPRRGRIFGGGWFGRTTFVDFAGGELGAGGAITTGLDVTASYRPEVLAYEARTSTWLTHTGTLEVRWSNRVDLDVGAAAIATTGPDRSTLTLLATLAWRPLP